MAARSSRHDLHPVVLGPVSIAAIIATIAIIAIIATRAESGM